MTTWWERATVTCARAVLVISMVFLVLGAPLIGFVTVAGALEGGAGAAESGLGVPVTVDVVLPAGALGVDTMSPTPGMEQVSASIGASSLGIGPAVVCLLLWFAIVAATMPSCVSLYRLSMADPGRRVGERLPGLARALAGWFVLAGVATSVGLTVSSCIAAGVVTDPAVHATFVGEPAITGLCAAGVMVLMAASLARGRQLEVEQDLTV